MSMLIRTGMVSFIPSGSPILWLPADHLNLADDDPVGTYSDQSGNGYDFTATGDARPTYKTNILNGKPIVRFDGFDDLLKYTGVFSSATEGTMIAVIANPYGTAGEYFFMASDDATDQHAWVGIHFWEYVPSSFAIGAGTKIDNNWLRVYGSTSLGTGFYLLVVQSDGSSFTLRVNGNVETITEDASGDDNGNWLGDVSNMDNMTLGGWGQSAPRYSKGDIAEIILYDTKISDIDLIANETGLNAKYAIY